MFKLLGFSWIIARFICVQILGDDLRLWVIVQMGGVILIGLWMINPSVNGRAHRLPWQWLIVAYVLAKGFEINDAALWRMTEGAASGHTLKHLVAAAGLVPVLVLAR